MLQPQLPILPPFRNEGLFTDHYLADVLPTAAALWTLDGMDAARAELAALWGDEAPKVAGYNEAQLEEHFIRPVLRVLGQVFEVQTAASSRQPDYGLFADEAARDGAKIVDPTGGRAYWSRALAVGDAKSWERKLDKATGTDAAWGFANPSFQNYHYLAQTGCRWALLTNGRHWRLYSGDPKPNLQVFYEVDLPALLEGQDPDALAYFWLFFRRAAFLRDPEGKCFLDKVRAESDLAAERLREDVKEGVYKALLETCRGFVGHTPNQLTDADLGAVHDNALVFLYRLLFVLYAEAGDLLPVRGNPQYRSQYSLHAIKQQVESAEPGTFLDGVANLAHSLNKVFDIRLIHAGDVCRRPKY